MKLTMDQELRLIELEVKRLEFLYKSYDKGNSAWMHYVGVAHTETTRMLDIFKEKWKIEETT